MPLLLTGRGGRTRLLGMLGEQLADGGDQLYRQADHRFPWTFVGSFILGYRFVFGLMLVVGQDAADALLIPARRAIHSFHQWFDPRMKTYLELPTRQKADEILAEAERRNPGPWAAHCRVAGACARVIAARHPEL